MARPKGLFAALRLTLAGRRRFAPTFRLPVVGGRTPDLRSGDQIPNRRYEKGPYLTAGPFFVYGAPEGIRTPDLCLRRAALYPAELRALGTA